MIKLVDTNLNIDYILHKRLVYEAIKSIISANKWEIYSLIRLVNYAGKE